MQLLQEAIDLFNLHGAGKAFSSEPRTYSLKPAGLGRLAESIAARRINMIIVDHEDREDSTRYDSLRIWLGQRAPPECAVDVGLKLLTRPQSEDATLAT